LPFKKIEPLPERIGDVISSDLCGPLETSIGGYKYFITWINHKSRYSSIEFLKNKECTTVTKSFKSYIAWLKRQRGEDIRRVRTDNGGEYTGKEFEEVCAQHGIIHETTTPYTPEHNGIAERYNRMLQEGALTLQHDASLTNRFWVSAVHTVNFVKNRILHYRIEKSPYEAFWGSKPKIDWLRIYGSRCWALIPEATRRKGNYKSVEGIFVGYYDNSKAYKVWVLRTHTLLKVRDVVFDELNHIERVIIHGGDDDDDEPTLWSNDNKIAITTKSIESKQDVLLDQEDIMPPLIENELVVERGVEPEERREEEAGEGDGEGDEEERQSEEREEEVNEGEMSEEEVALTDFSRGPWMDPLNVEYGRGRIHTLLSEATAIAHGERDLEEMETAFVVLASDEPANYKEAMSSTNAEEWKKAFQAEYDTLMGYQTWTLV
jgi:Integrase core domain